MNNWKRHGYYYHSKLNIYDGGENQVLLGSIQKRLGFISYHLIRLIHGQSKLDAMALDLKGLVRIIDGLGNIYYGEK